MLNFPVGKKKDHLLAVSFLANFQCSKHVPLCNSVYLFVKWRRMWDYISEAYICHIDAIHVNISTIFHYSLKYYFKTHKICLLIDWISQCNLSWPGTIQWPRLPTNSWSCINFFSAGNMHIIHFIQFLKNIQFQLASDTKNYLQKILTKFKTIMSQWWQLTLST